jgi:hypothetical protein
MFFCKIESPTSKIHDVFVQSSLLKAKEIKRKKVNTDRLSTLE